MHPPLDRPHPDCQDVISELRECHSSAWKKFSGQCNDVKFRLDACLREEKRKVLEELDRELPARQALREEVVKQAFGKQMTFSEYLERDADYQRERRRKEEQQQQGASAAK